MMSVKTLFFFVLSLCLVLATSSFAADTDLYVGGGSGVKPNILIIFDTSGSMNDTVDTGNEYDADYTYPADPDHPDIVPTVVYKKNSSGSWFSLNIFKNLVSEVGCPTAQSVLTSDGKGVYYGRPNWDASRSRCSGGQVTLATGNWLNFYLASDGIVGNMKKIDIAKQVTKNFLDTVEDVRVGVMRFGSITQSGGTDSDEGGRIVYDITDLTDDNRSDIKSAIDSLSASGWTPLAETFYEAGLYFKGAESHFNWINSTTKKQYSSPIQYWCQKTYVVIMTDGISTQDRNSVLGSAIGDQNDDLREPPCADTSNPDPPCYYDNDGSDYLDDVAKYYYDIDFRSDLESQQNLVTYTIGYELSDTDPDSPKARDLLQRTAQLGHGKYFSANNTAGLADAFTTILSEILAKTSSFVAPIVPVSRLERTMAGDRIYLAFFKPEQIGVWSGNIKKYGVAQARDASKGIEAGDVLDASGSKALDSSGQFYSTSTSYWTTSGQDGGEVEKGGVGEVLKNRTSAREIYTYLGTNADLTDSSNAFARTNSLITPSILGVATTEERDKIIDYVHGLDAYDDDGNNNFIEKREWILGSFLHSRPFIIHYADRTVIYAGSNDGMLHAFDDETGEELWALIPPDLLSRLYELHTDYPGVFVDGTPKAYMTYDSNSYPTKVILIFGLRRGGNKYYALDVTNPLSPKFAWKIDPDTMTQFAEMGQSWSSPVIGKIASGTGEQWVAIIGGGYDEGQDEDSPPADDRGRAIYMVDVLTGSLVWKYSYAENSAITYCIPSDITKLDVNADGKIDRLYVGDTNARIWRFDIGNSDTASSWTGKIIFQSNTGVSEKRKIFYPPDVSFEKDGSIEYEMLFFGTGDREDPKNMDVNKIDRLYAVKDKNSGTTLKDLDLMNMTEFYSQTEEGQVTMINDIKTMSGWYIVLENSGEKCLASPVVFSKTVYYTTFSPTFGSETDPCFVGEGTARFYALNYATGEAVFNMDLTNDTGGTVIAKSDRSKVIGTAIPSGVIITVIGGQATAYVGVGGGVYSPQLRIRKTLYPLNWKMVF